MVIKRSTNSPSALPIAQSAISKPSFELETNVSNTDLSTKVHIHRNKCVIRGHLLTEDDGNCKQF